MVTPRTAVRREVAGNDHQVGADAAQWLAVVRERAHQAGLAFLGLGLDVEVGHVKDAHEP
jgi:gamma-glutamylcysteine synthetase